MAAAASGRARLRATARDVGGKLLRGGEALLVRGAAGASDGGWDAGPGFSLSLPGSVAARSALTWATGTVAIDSNEEGPLALGVNAAGGRGANSGIFGI